MPDILNLNDLYRSKIDTRQRLDYSPGTTRKSSLYGATPAQKIQLIEQQKAIQEYQKSLQEPKDGGFFEDLFSAFGQGWATGESVDEAFDIFKLGANVDDATLQSYINAVNKMDAYGQTHEQWSFQQDLEKHGGGFFGGLAALIENPGYLPQLIAGSLGTMISSFQDSEEVMMATGAGFGVGAAAGSYTGIGAIGTGFAGAFTGLTGAMETGLTLSELIKDELGGLPFNKENVRSVLDKPGTFKSIKNRSLARGVTIGAIEGVTMGISRGVGSKLLRTSTDTRFKTGLKISGATAGIEMVGGGLGELSGQLAAGQELKGDEIFLEAIAETKGIVNVSDIIKKTFAKTEYKINGGKASEQDILDFINDKKLTDKELTGASIEIWGNEELSNKVRNVQIKANIRQNIDKSVTNPIDRNKLVDLELKRLALEEQNKKKGVFKGPNIKKKLQQTEEQIAGIIDKYEGVTAEDVTGVTKKTLAAVSLQEKYQKDVSFAERYAGIYDLTLNELEDDVAIDQYAQENNLSQEQIDDLKRSNGFINDQTGEIVINKQKALKQGRVDVANHELLHGILRKAVREGKINRNLIKDLRAGLGKAWSVIEQKIKEGGYDTMTVEADKEMAERLGVKEGDKVSYLDANPDEYITLLSEAIQEEKVKFNENILTKLNDLLTPIFRAFGFRKIKFDNSRDVLKFLKEYNTSIKKGTLSKAIIKATASKREGSTRIARSLSPEARQQVSDNVQEIGGTYSFQGGKKLWDEGGADNAIAEIQQNGYLDDLIAAKFKGDRVPEGFVDKVYSELTNHIRNFNPEVNDNLFAWINSQLANKAGNVFNREYKTTTEQRTAKDIGERTKEGDVKVQVAAEEDVAMKKLEEEDISPQAEAKRKREAAKKKEPTYSELRKAMGIETKSDIYNNVLEAARKVLIRAYDAGKTARQIQRDLTKEASTYLFKQVKNMLGVGKNYIPTIKKLRVPLINSMFTADLVQMERNVPDNEKVFTRFVKNLTSKEEVQAAVDQNLLPPSALNTIDKGQSVALYEKVMPTEKQFLAFFDVPIINPKTGIRSGLRGTRKDQLAKYTSASLNYDATMQVAQEPEVIEKRQQIAELRGETVDGSDVQNLSVVIGRKPNIKFSFSKATDSEQNIATHVSNFIRDINENNKSWEDFIVIDENGDASLKKTIKRVYGRGPKEMPLEDQNLVAKMVRNISISEDFGILTDEVYKAELINDIVVQRGKGKKINLGNAHENNIKTRLEKVLEILKSRLKFVDGRGDVYLSNTLGNLVVGIEVKLNKARGVSQIVNFTNKGKKLNFANKNKTEQDGNNIDDLIGNEILEKLSEINDFFKSNGLGEINENTFKLTPDQAIALNAVKSIFQVEIQLNNVNYITHAYAHGKYSTTPQGFIILGENIYFMETGNKLVDKLHESIKNEYNKNNPNNKIETLKLNDDKTISLIGGIYRPAYTGKLSYRINPVLNSSDFVKTANILDDTVNKNFGKATDSAMKRFSRSKASTDFVNITERAAAPLKYSKTSKGMSTFDFDETLIIEGKNFITATSPNGVDQKISSGDWPVKGPELSDQGYTFDFSDFVNIRGGTEGPLLQKMRNQIKKFGSDNVFVLTARPAESATAIHGWLRSKNINISIDNITGLGNSTGEAKAMWMLEKYAEGYNDMYFVDDALSNVRAVKDVLDQLDVKGKSVQAKIKFSKNTNKKFNDILEEASGVDSKKRFSDAQAKLLGKKFKLRALVPPSAQDFAGLLYNFLPRGEKGEKAMKFFKKSLIDPFAKGINKLNTARQKSAEEYTALLKTLPKIKKKLKKKLSKYKDAPKSIGEFTVDQAVRVYLWNKAGFDIPGLSKRDLNALDSFVKNDSELQSFADQIGNISKKEKGYAEPGEYWLVENIKSDLLSDGAIGDVRGKFLQEWQENVDTMFSKENLNKIEAIYGSKFREALEDSLYAMKTGSNRPTGSNRLTNMYMNWVNNSVGAIMFFNIRSAVLQTISSINYINWTDNNPLKAGAALANQKQFWKDFVYIFNSDFLKQRRAGNQRGVNESELMNAIEGSDNPIKAALAWLLNKGFLPTQIADSFAISSGGAMFYRNRVNTYLKQGMDQKAAEEKAFLDFQERTEVAQQSARPDLISQQQRNPLGRLILAFQNAPMQYGRIMNKAFRDIYNRRGDTKTHISKIIYYGGIQASLFAALQTAIWASLDEEDEEEFDEKKYRMLNSMVDGWLSTFGYGGKAVTTIKNTIQEYDEQRAKDLDEDFMTKSDHAYTILQALSFSPPIQSKLRKIYQSTQTEKFNRDIIMERGLSLDNPVWSMVGNVFEGVTNVPLGRLSNKMSNLDNAMDSRHETWQRLALLMGWNKWDLGIKDPDIVALGEEIRERKKREKKMDNEREKIDIQRKKLEEEYPEKTEQEINEAIQIKEKTKQVFDLNKSEQVKIIEGLNLNPKDYSKEQDRVNIIIDNYNKNPEKIDSTLQAIKNYTPTVSEKKSIDLFKMTKKDQVNRLIDLGLSNKQIKELKYEEDRVNKIIELESKEKK